MSTNYYVGHINGITERAKWTWRRSKVQLDKFEMGVAEPFADVNEPNFTTKMTESKYNVLRKVEDMTYNSYGDIM